MVSKGKAAKQVAIIIEKNIKKAMVTALTKSCELVQGTAMQLCPRGKRFGVDIKNPNKISSANQLANSIEYEVDESKLQGTVFTNVKYAPSVEFGSIAHIIRPKNKKALAWGRATGTTKSGDIKRETVLRPGQEVRHPGAKAQPFLRPALDSSRLNIKKIFAHHINKIK